MPPLALGGLLVLHALTVHLPSAAPAADRAPQAAPTCSAQHPGTDLYCHASYNGTKNFPMWCNDIAQVPTAGPASCCALCLQNATWGGPCTAWSFNFGSKLCFMKSPPPLSSPCKSCQKLPGKPMSSTDTSGWLYPAGPAALPPQPPDPAGNTPMVVLAVLLVLSVAAPALLYMAEAGCFRPVGPAADKDAALLLQPTGPPVYRARWWALFVFSLMSAVQNAVWISMSVVVPQTTSYFKVTDHPTQSSLTCCGLAQ